jgi:ABC-type transporter Mla subunit MlaD
MTPQTISKLRRISDDAADLAEAVNAHDPDAAALITKAQYALEDARELLSASTAKAVGEVVQDAFTHHGGQGDAEPVTLRRRMA